MIQPATPYTGDPVSLPLHLINTRPQIRTRNGFDETSLRELAETIKLHGLMQPLVVHRSGDDSYELIAGERRLLACELAGLAEVPVLVRAVGDADEAKVLQAIENLQREQLTLLDRAEGVASIVKAKGAKMAAKLLGKSSAWISKHVGVTTLAELVRQAASEGGCEDIEVLHCVNQLGKRIDGQLLYAAALKKLAAGELSRAEARELLDQANKPKEPAAGESGGEGDGEGEGGDEGDGGAEKEKFGKLELAKEVAFQILAALNYAKEHKPSSRPSDATIEHVKDFIGKTWGK